MNTNPKASFSFFLLLSIATAVSVAAVAETVKDPNGHPLSPEIQYLIQPATNDGRGGLVPASIELSSRGLCPLGIVQTFTTFLPGKPVTFTSSSSGNITTNTDLSITFQCRFWACKSSKIWEVNFSSSFNNTYITTGGVFGAKESLFRIEEYGNEEKSYKLVYYESGLSTKGKNVGATASIYFGLPILVLNAEDDEESNAFPLKFKKAKTSMEINVLDSPF